jgi:hypothetical protein
MVFKSGGGGKGAEKNFADTHFFLKLNYVIFEQGGGGGEGLKNLRYICQKYFLPLSFCNFFEKSNKSKILFALAKICTAVATEWAYSKINSVSVGGRRT